MVNDGDEAGVAQLERERVALDGLLGRLMSSTSYAGADIEQVSAQLFGGQRSNMRVGVSTYALVMSGRIWTGTN